MATAKEYRIYTGAINVIARHVAPLEGEAPLAAGELKKALTDLLKLSSDVQQECQVDMLARLQKNPNYEHDLNAKRLEKLVSLLEIDAATAKLSDEEIAEKMTAQWKHAEENMAYKEELKKTYAEVKNYMAYEEMAQISESNTEAKAYVENADNKKAYEATKAHLFEKMQALFAADKDLLDEVMAEQKKAEEEKFAALPDGKDSAHEISLQNAGNRIDDMLKEHRDGAAGLENMTDEEKKKLEALGFSIDEFTQPNDRKLWEKIIANGYKKDGTALEGDTKGKDDDGKPIGITEGEGKEGEETADPWVKEKLDWYNARNASLIIDGYEVVAADVEHNTTFAVKMYGATVHYSSKNKATVSQGAPYEVFATILQEDHNKNRPVEFPADASKHLTNMLYAASILNKMDNGEVHEMVGLEAVASQLDLAYLKEHLKEADYKVVEAYYNAHKGDARDTREGDTRGGEGDTKGGPTRPELKKMAAGGEYSIFSRGRKNDEKAGGKDTRCVIITGKSDDGKDFKLTYTQKDGKFTYEFGGKQEDLVVEDYSFLVENKVRGFLAIQDGLESQIQSAMALKKGGKIDAEADAKGKAELAEAFIKDPQLFKKALQDKINKNVNFEKDATNSKGEKANIRTVRNADVNEALRRAQIAALGLQGKRDEQLIKSGIIAETAAIKQSDEDKKTAKEMADNLQQFNAAKKTDKDLSLDKYIETKYPDLKGEDLQNKVAQQRAYNRLVQKYQNAEANKKSGGR